MLVSKRRLVFDRDVLEWIRDALAEPKIRLLPLTPEVAVTSTALALHGDPADRIIVATALEQGAELVTADAALQKAGIVRCVW
jgi:PIN domain nuclease of toxin-antitoxin system